MQMVNHWSIMFLNQQTDMMQNRKQHQRKGMQLPTRQPLLLRTVTVDGVNCICACSQWPAVEEGASRSVITGSVTKRFE